MFQRSGLSAPFFTPNRPKYILKANYNDPSHCRNVVCADIWAEMVQSRARLPRELTVLSNYGAADGFPVSVYLNDEFHGLYTLTLHKDDDLFGMEDGKKQALLILNDASSEEAYFRAETSFGLGSPWEIEFCGTGTEADPYLIRSESHMGYFISQLNEGINFEGNYIQLDADLDMTGHPWTYPYAASFAGTFIGNAHTVETDCTLLPDIAASGVVTGLNVEAKTTVTRAILCDYNHGLIQMCCVRGDVVDDSSDIAGMICAENNGTVQYCGAIGSISANGSSV